MNKKKMIENEELFFTFEKLEPGNVWHLSINDG